jgi:hypothetical protein
MQILNLDFLESELVAELHSVEGAGRAWATGNVFIQAFGDRSGGQGASRSTVIETPNGTYASNISTGTAYASGRNGGAVSSSSSSSVSVTN